MSNGAPWPDWVKWLLGLLAALITGYVGYLYRDSFDQPHVSVEALYADIPRKSISLPADLLRRVRTEGEHQDFIDKLVPWEYKAALERNELTYAGVGDLLELLPKFDVRVRSHRNLFSDQEGILQKFLSGDPETDGIYWVLSTRRNYYLNIRTLDLFEVFDKDPKVTARMLLNDTKGDIAGADFSLRIGSDLAAFLEQEYGRGLPEPRPIVGGEIPDVVYIVTAANTGRTDALIRNHAKLSGGGWFVDLIGYDLTLKRRQRENRHHKVESFSVAEIAFVPNLATSQPKLRDAAYKATKVNAGPFTLSLETIGGEEIEFVLEKFPEDPD